MAEEGVGGDREQGNENYFCSHSFCPHYLRTRPESAWKLTDLKRNFNIQALTLICSLPHKLLVYYRPSKTEQTWRPSLISFSFLHLCITHKILQISLEHITSHPHLSHLQCKHQSHRLFPTSPHYFLHWGQNNPSPSKETQLKVKTENSSEIVQIVRKTG